MTKEELSKLRSNVEKIEAYIKAEIIPHLNGTRARVDFGDMQTYVGEPHREREYHLSVSPQGVSGWTGYLGLTMLPEDDGPTAFGRSFCSPDAGITLLRNWPTIKKALLNHIKDVEETNVLLDDFTV